MEKIFKAKLLDSGEWVEFDFNQCRGADTSNGYRVNLTDNLYYSNIVRLDPKTICQYTGINDSEGNRIFEGDYCDCEIYRNENSMKTEKHNGFVVFNEFEYCLEMESHFFPVASWKIIHSAKLTGHNIHERGE